MHNLLKFGTCLGVAISLAGCSTSEHFMQDDVYNTRTPIMPPGTDLNDVTDYATFVARKEQTQTPDKTTYVSPRQYNDYFYNSQYIYYGYSPYGALTGLGYYGYGNYYSTYNNGIFYPSIGFSSYYGGSGNYYYHPYNGYYYGSNPYSPYYGYGGYYSGNSYSYTPISKPNTGGNIGNAHAGTATGRMGSTTGGGIISYQNKLNAKPTARAGVGRNTTINSSPVVSNGRNPVVSTRETVRPVSPGRNSVPTERTSSGTYRRVESTPNSRGNNRTINTNTTPRTSSPTIRSGGGSGGSVSSPGSGGSRSGGRR